MVPFERADKSTPTYHYYVDESAAFCHIRHRHHCSDLVQIV